MKYQEIHPISRSLAIQLLAENRDKLTIDTLLRLAYHDTDWKWVQGKCIEYSYHHSKAVRRAAVQCLGHLARINKDIDLDLVRPVLISLHSDPDMVGYVEDTIDDIEMFVGHRLSLNCV